MVDTSRPPQFLLDRVIEALQLLVGHLQVLAVVLGPSPAAHHKQGNAKDQQAHHKAAGKYEGRQVTLSPLFESRQRSEVQGPLASGHQYSALFEEEKLVPLLLVAPYAVAVVDRRARRRIPTVVDLGIYRWVEGSLEDPVQQLVAYERPNDEPSERTPTLGDAPLRLSLLVDREVDDKTRSQGEVRCGVSGSIAEHIDHLCGTRLPAIARQVHSLLVHSFSIEIVVEHALVGLVKGADVG